MKQLKIIITARDKPALLSRLQKIKQNIEQGCFAGFGGNRREKHEYHITEVSKYE